MTPSLSSSYVNTITPREHAYSGNLGVGPKLEHSFEIKLSEQSEDEGSDYEDGEIRPEDQVTYAWLFR